MDDPRGRLTKDGIRIYEPVDFAGMHIAGRLAAEILDDVAALVEPGVTTGVLDDFIRERVEAAGARSATIGYRGYQHASCISVNHVVCHGIPDDKPLRDGDIVSRWSTHSHFTFLIFASSSGFGQWFQFETP